MTNKLEGIDLNAPPPKQEEPEKEEKKEDEKKDKSIADYLTEYDNSPSEADVEGWKQKHGEVLCSILSEKELYIFRPITREEFVNLQAHIAQAGGQVSNFEVEQIVVDTCVLWASTEGIASTRTKAGTLSTLHEQVLQASNFMNAAYVSQFVIKL